MGNIAYYGNIAKLHNNGQELLREYINGRFNEMIPKNIKIKAF
jgi:hypothetical protein